MFSATASAAELISAGYLAGRQRILLFGESGSGKSTLAAGLAQTLARSGHSCTCIGADPGSPAFGLPGAICLGRWQDDAWQLGDLEALCTLDGGRFRLPLVSAVRRLSLGVDQGLVLVDAPGVVRSVAGAELLQGLVEAAAIDAVFVLCRGDAGRQPLSDELATLGCQVVFIQAAAEARPPSHRQRARWRTRLWNDYLAKHGVITSIAPFDMQLTGTPPPLERKAQWCGRQIGLLKDGKTIAMGEVISAANGIFQVRTGHIPEMPDQILTRNAGRNSHGYLVTVKPTGALNLHYLPPPDVAPYDHMATSPGPRPVARIGDATGILVNGIFGDPLLHLRLHNRKRSILFDLGEGSRLPARLAHQLSDVFISHAHIDHISGFLWLLRSRIGNLPACRLFGPPGLAGHIGGLINGIHWDRIGDWGPRFEVGELHGDRLVIHFLQAGRQREKKPVERPAPRGLLTDEPTLKVWALTLAHGSIPVLAYSLEQPPKLSVRRDRLAARNLAPGPWLRELKKCIGGGDRRSTIQLPDASTRRAGELADDLIQVTPPLRLVYATDIADTGENREKLEALARGAHTFFCEAAFMEADRKNAERSGHLTGRACGEIARAAGVEQLVPFHFSRRYEKSPLQVYNEVKESWPHLLVPDNSGFTSG